MNDDVMGLSWKRIKKRVKRAVKPPKKVRRAVSKLARKMVHPKIRGMYEDAKRRLPKKAHPALAAMLVPGLGIPAASAIVTVQLAKYGVDKVTRRKSQKKISKAKRSARRGSAKGSARFSRYRKANTLSKAASKSRSPRGALSRYRSSEQKRRISQVRRGSAIKQRGNIAAKTLLRREAGGRPIRRGFASRMLSRIKGQALKRGAILKQAPKPKGARPLSPSEQKSLALSKARRRPVSKRRGMMRRRPGGLSRLMRRKPMMRKPKTERPLSPTEKKSLALKKLRDLKPSTRPKRRPPVEDVEPLPMSPMVKRPSAPMEIVDKPPLPPMPPPIAPVLPPPPPPYPLAPLPEYDEPEAEPIDVAPPTPQLEPMYVGPTADEYYPEEEEYYEEEDYYPQYPEEAYMEPELAPDPMPVEDEAWDEEQYYEDDYEDELWDDEGGDEEYYAEEW